MATPNQNLSHGELEQQLRSMILGNVKIGEGEPVQQGKENYSHRQSRGNYNARRGHGRRAHDGPADRSSWDESSQNLHHGSPVQILQRPNRGQASARGARQASQVPPYNHRQPGANPSKFQSFPRQPPPPGPQEINSQCMFLESIAGNVLPLIEMTVEESRAKDQFRAHLERLCQQALIDQSPEDYIKIGLAPFGSLASGFGMPGSDMDLVLCSSQPEVDLRLLEKTLLDAGIGAHLLARTRVPILKICEKPTPDLYAALCQERQKYDDMTPEEREEYDHPSTKQEGSVVAGEKAVKSAQNDETAKDVHSLGDETKDLSPSAPPDPQQIIAHPIEPTSPSTDTDEKTEQDLHKPAVDSSKTPNRPRTQSNGAAKDAPRPRKQQKTWYREKRPGALDFPSYGVGIQSDINSNNPLGLHNTRLLRTYSFCDIRVRLLILFVKAWASRRKINSPRNSTLSSYGYVLMALHFCVNVASPPICPNLQLGSRSRRFDATGAFLPRDDADPAQTCDGCDVRFWDDERAIQALAAEGRLTANHQPLGVLLRDFFAYYATQTPAAPQGGFSWTTSVLSLRTPGGILSKDAKGWTGAKTTIGASGEVRHRYLFAVEDPFELEHNVARTVTHNGIVAIRDEFRRAWRIITAAGYGRKPEGELFEEVVSMPPPKEDEERKDQGHSQEEKEGAEEVDGSHNNVTPQSVASAANMSTNEHVEQK